MKILRKKFHFLIGWWRRVVYLCVWQREWQRQECSSTFLTQGGWIGAPLNLFERTPLPSLLSTFEIFESLKFVFRIEDFFSF